MFPVFDPRDAACKSPFGAVACGAEVSFTLRDGDYYACELLVHREFAGVDEVCPLPPAEGGFSGIYTAPQEPDLCWYAFRSFVPFSVLQDVSPAFFPIPRRWAPADTSP